MKKQDSFIISDRNAVLWKLLGKNGFIAIKEIQGTIIRIKYIRVCYSNLLLRVLNKLRLYNEYKDIIYWNPYKNIVSSSNKYSVIGPKSRGINAKIWFEVDRRNDVYERFANKFILNYQSIPFPGTDLKAVTSKRLKSILDTILYTDQNK
jgi:hypothetical protein